MGFRFMGLWLDFTVQGLGLMGDVLFFRVYVPFCSRLRSPGTAVAVKRLMYPKP